MEKLVILDYGSNKVHFYNVDREAPIDEQYIEDLGLYDSNSCYWMVGDFEIIHHKGTLV